MSRIAIRGPIHRAELPGLCARVCRLLDTCAAATELDCDVAGVPADAVTVDALARLQLAARRHGRRITLRRASDELRDLVCLMGLEDILA